MIFLHNFSIKQSKRGHILYHRGANTLFAPCIDPLPHSAFHSVFLSNFGFLESKACPSNVCAQPRASANCCIALVVLLSVLDHSTCCAARGCSSWARALSYSHGHLMSPRLRQLYVLLQRYCPCYRALCTAIWSPFTTVCDPSGSNSSAERRAFFDRRLAHVLVAPLECLQKFHEIFLTKGDDYWMTVFSCKLWLWCSVNHWISLDQNPIATTLHIHPPPWWRSSFIFTR